MNGSARTMSLCNELIKILIQADRRVTQQSHNTYNLEVDGLQQQKTPLISITNREKRL